MKQFDLLMEKHEPVFILTVVDISGVENFPCRSGVYSG